MKNKITIVFLLFALSAIFQFPAFGQEKDAAECWHEELNELSFLTRTWVLDSNFRLEMAYGNETLQNQLSSPIFTIVCLAR